MSRAQTPRLVAFTRAATDTVVCSSVIVADSMISRLVGLLRHSILPPENGLWLLPASSVHTFGMKFSIDLVALDRDLRVTAVMPCVPPGRAVSIRERHHSILELAAGRSHSVGLVPGDALRAQAVSA